MALLPHSTRACYTKRPHDSCRGWGLQRLDHKVSKHNLRTGQLRARLITDQFTTHTGLTQSQEITLVNARQITQRHTDTVFPIKQPSYILSPPCYPAVNLPLKTRTLVCLLEECPLSSLRSSMNFRTGIGCGACINLRSDQSPSFLQVFNSSSEN